MKRRIPGSGLLFDLGSESIDAYAGGTPALDLKDYLSGALTASGIFVGLSGCVDRRFVVEMHGNWNGDTGTLDERFRFADGETGDRVWSMRFADNGRFTASAADVVGEAHGLQRGNAATMRYRLRVPRRAGEIVVGMEDWFYLMDDGTLVNRARMTKFGLKVGELATWFRKCVDTELPAPRGDRK